MPGRAEIEWGSSENGGTQRLTLTRDTVRIGRAHDNDIVVRDVKVSRHHASLVWDGAAYAIENLSRTNVVRVNDEPVEHAVLQDGDTLVLGDSRLFFHDFARKPAPDGKPSEPECITIDARNRDILLAGIDEQDIHALQRAKADLTALYRAGRILNASLSTEALCRQSLTTILEEMPAVDCCSIHLLDDSTGELDCRAARFRSDEPNRLPRTFSRTILNQVLAEHKGVLTYDAQGDDRFESARSIASLNIRSAMCVPMQVGSRLTGVLQAHTLDARHRFTVEDLKLLTAFGMLSGVAIENARLYEALDAERVLQADKARLMQIMMHELKSPIAGARMMAETLRMQLVQPDKQADFAHRIVRRLDDMLEWIKDALDLSKLKSGEGLDRGEQFDLCAVTRETAHEYAARAADKGVAFELNIPEAGWTVFMPGTPYRLVVSNLVSNAVKYTQEGHVRVTLRRHDRQAVLEVSDTGIGIPAKDIPKMFEEFFRASNARSAKIEGSGIGLASVKCIVENLGGTLDLLSEEGKGSVFTAAFPITAP